MIDRTEIELRVARASMTGWRGRRARVSNLTLAGHT